MPNFTTGAPLFFRDPCPAADYSDKPSGYYIRVGAGLPPYAYEQDCAIYEEHSDRVRVVAYTDNAGVDIPVVRIEGDSPNRSGGAEIIRPLAHPTAWASGAGVRETINFMLSDEVRSDAYCVFELRGKLDLPDLHNEAFSALLVVVRNNLFKVKYYCNATDAKGGGARHEETFGYTFEYRRWYRLVMRLLPVPSIPHTWDLKVRMSRLDEPDYKIVFRPAPQLRPNHIVSIEGVAIGDEQQRIQSGGVVYLSMDADVAVPARKEGGDL